MFYNPLYAIIFEYCFIGWPCIFK